jgi:hypothetical protein
VDNSVEHLVKTGRKIRNMCDINVTTNLFPFPEGGSSTISNSFIYNNKVGKGKKEQSEVISK